MKAQKIEVVMVLTVLFMTGCINPWNTIGPLIKQIKTVQTIVIFTPTITPTSFIYVPFAPTATATLTMYVTPDVMATACEGKPGSYFPCRDYNATKQATATVTNTAYIPTVTPTITIAVYVPTATPLP